MEEACTQCHCNFHSFRRLYNNNTFFWGEPVQPQPASSSLSGHEYRCCHAFRSFV